MNELCKHFPKCGGCQIMDLSEEAQKHTKITAAQKAFEKYGIEWQLDDYIVMSDYSRRRASITSKRTKKGVTIGFLEKTTHNIIPITECRVLDPKILNCFTFIETMTKLLGARSRSMKFHITICDNGIDIAVENAKPMETKYLAQIAHWAQSHQIIRIQINEEQIFISEQPYILMKEIRAILPIKSFLQASKEAETTLRQLAHAPLRGHVADLYSGLGTFSFGLSGEVDAYEGAKEAVLAMQETIRKNMLNKTRAHQRDLFRYPLTAQELSNFDSLIIDPPRAGAEPQIYEIAQSSVNIISYISCSLDSFARDAKILLNAGFEMTEFILLDQFRYSQHIESFALFQKRT